LIKCVLKFGFCMLFYFTAPIVTSATGGTAAAAAGGASAAHRIRNESSDTFPDEEDSENYNSDDDDDVLPADFLLRDATGSPPNSPTAKARHMQQLANSGNTSTNIGAGGIGGTHAASASSATTTAALAVPVVEAAILKEPKRRDKKTNAQASQLRSQISMTEYEITRLSKLLRKRAATLQGIEGTSTVATGGGGADAAGGGDASDVAQAAELNAEIQTLNCQINRLYERQQSFKDQYLDLTGMLTSSTNYSVRCMREV
jgi:chaperonin cofactor prefoldin